MGRLALRYNVDTSLAIAIVGCESNFDPGAINHNKNNTYDWGLFQWNDIWVAQFKKIGLDVKNNPIDNIEAGMMTLKTTGSSPWRYSRSCWSSKLNNYGTYDTVGTSTLPYFVAMR